MEGGAPEELTVLGRRIDVVEELTGEPLHKADLVERLDHSRSTVNRAVKELEDAGYVERVTEGYVATQVGQLAAQRYRTHVEDQRAILAAGAVLGAVPHEASVPAGLLTDAHVETDAPRYRLFELLAEEMGAADAYRVVVPALLDSRHLRLCHSLVVEGDLALTLQAPTDVLSDVAAEFPRLWSELVESEAFTARTGETLPYGLFVADVDGEPSAATLVGIEDGDVTGFVHTEGAEATAWAADRVDSLAVEESGAVDLGAAPTAGLGDLTPLTGARLPASLRSAGFVRVDEDYLDRQEPLAPTTAWRTPLDLPEIAAGYAVERTVDADRVDRDADGEVALVDLLVERLGSAVDVALVGPPGSGKSTVCKSVAHRWHETGRGTVLYRESGAGKPFESPASLEAALERADGHALVVVEDAVRPDANAVVEVARTFSGRDDVSFLLDARESEWRDPEEFPVDARLRAFRREAIETVTMPPLDEADCRRVIDRVAAVTDQRLDVSAADLLADLQRTAGGGEEARPGVVSLLFHRLTRYLDPLATDAETTLDEDVDRVRADLRSIGEDALDAGVLVNLLNAAGLGVARAYVHAVAAGDPEAHEQVRAALARLEGHVLFPADDEAGPYRAVNDVWSTRFLERLLEEDGERAAERRFGRVVTSLLALADLPAVREAVARQSGGDTRALDRVVAAPGDWAAETTASVFALGRTYPKLAPLFGTTAETAITLPTACSESLRARTTEWRGRMYAAAGRPDRADGEFDRLASAVDDLPAAAAERARLESLLGHADVARRRGETDAAADYARDALDHASDTGDPQGEARARLTLGGIANDRGEPDEAETHLDAALSTFEDRSAPLWTARALSELGDVAMARGEYDAAVDRFERSLDICRSVGDRRGAARALGDLGTVSSKRGEHGVARERFLRALEVARELGDRGLAAEFLKWLGDTARQQGDYDRAGEHAEQALAAYEAVGDRHGVARVRRDLGTIAGRREAFDEARDHFREALAAFEDVGDRTGIARVHYNLGTVAGKQGDYEEASERYERALAAFEAVGNRHAIGGVHHNLGMIAQGQGNYERARDRYRQAMDRYEEIGDRHGIARTRINLGVVAMRRGDYGAATEYFEQARAGVEAVGDDHQLALLDRHEGVVATQRGDYETAERRLERALATFEDLDARQGIARTHLSLGRLARERGDHETAAEHCERALSLAERTDNARDAARAHLERGRVALATGDTGTAAARADAAEGALADRDARHVRADVCRLRGRVAAEDDPAAAIEAFEAALDGYEAIGARGDVLETLSLLVETAREADRADVASEWRDYAAETLAEAPADLARHHDWVDRELESD